MKTPYQLKSIASTYSENTVVTMCPIKEGVNDKKPDAQIVVSREQATEMLNSGNNVYWIIIQPLIEQEIDNL